MLRLYRRFCAVERIIAMVALLATTLLIFLSSLMRFLGVPMNWSLEISMFIFAWCVFLSADVALRENRMVNLDLVINRLPPKGKAFLALLCNILILVFLVVVVIYGLDLAWRTRVRMFQGINFSYSWVALSLPVASLFMVITACLKIRSALHVFLHPAAAGDKAGPPEQQHI